MGLASDTASKVRNGLLWLIATFGVGGVGVVLTGAAKAWSAVGLVEHHERQLKRLELNGYLTCLMVKQLYAERQQEVKLTLNVDLDCKEPYAKETH